MTYTKPPIAVKVIVDSMTSFSIRMTPIYKSDEINYTYFPYCLNMHGAVSDIPANDLPSLRRVFEKGGRVIVRNPHGQKDLFLITELSDRLTLVPVDMDFSYL